MKAAKKAKKARKASKKAKKRGLPDPAEAAEAEGDGDAKDAPKEEGDAAPAEGGADAEKAAVKEPEEPALKEPKVVVVGGVQEWVRAGLLLAPRRRLRRLHRPQHRTPSHPGARGQPSDRA